MKYDINLTAFGQDEKFFSRTIIFASPKERNFVNRVPRYQCVIRGTLSKGALICGGGHLVKFFSSGRALIQGGRILKETMQRIILFSFLRKMFHR